MKPLLACLLLLSTFGFSAAHAADDTGPKAYEAAMALYTAEKYPESEKAALALVAARTKSLGAEDQETLRARLLLAQILFKLDKDAESEAQLQNLLPIMTRVFGAEHRVTLVCQSALLKTLGSQGRDAAADEPFRRLIAIETRVLGPEDAETLMTRRYFTRGLCDLGKAAEAEQVCHQVLAASRRVHGAEARETLRTWNALVWALFAQGKDAEAETQLRELLPLTTKVYGTAHPETLLCQSRLIYALAHQEKSAEVAEQARSLIPLQTRVHGAAATETLETRRQYAKALSALGNHAAAEQELREVLATCQHTFGAQANETLHSRVALALASAGRGRPAAAETELRELLPLVAQAFGEEHDDTVLCHGTLLEVLRSQEKYAESESEIRKWIAIVTRVIGPDAPSTLAIRTDLARDLEAQGKYAEATQEWRAILAIVERTLGAAESDAVDLCYCLALCLKKAHQTPEALTYAQRALAGHLKLLGQAAPATVASQRLMNMLTYSTPHGLQQQAAAPKASPKDRPLAMVDGALILASDLREYLQTEAESLRRHYAASPGQREKELAELKLTALDRLIDEQLLLDEFTRLGGVLKKKYIDEEVDNVIKDTFKGDRAAFLADRAEKGQPMEKFRTQCERKIILVTMRRRIVSDDIKVSEEEVQEYFEQNKQRWSMPAQVKIRTLTIPKTDTSSRSVAAALRTKISNGADFAATARASSQDSHAEDGGAWDWMPRSDLAEDVGSAVAKLKKGGVSDVIELENSFLIVRLDDFKDREEPDFEKLKDEFSQLARQEKGKNRINLKLESLREEADIQKMEAL